MTGRGVSVTKVCLGGLGTFLGFRSLILNYLKLFVDICYCWMFRRSEICELERKWIIRGIIAKDNFLAGIPTGTLSHK